LTFKIPENKDADFVWKEFQDVVGSELVGNFSNFVNRTMTFIKSKFGGKIPSPGKLSAEDEAMLARIGDAVARFDEQMDGVHLANGLREILALSASANQYLQAQAPWKNAERAPTVMYVCANVVYALANLMEPFLPETKERMLKMLDAKPLGLDLIAETRLAGEHVLGEPEILFRPLSDDDIKRLDVATKPQ